MSFEGQREILPSILEVIREEEDLSYNKDITSRSKEELEKLTRGDDNVQDLKALVVMEDEPASSESHDTMMSQKLIEFFVHFSDCSYNVIACFYEEICTIYQISILHKLLA